MPKTKLLIIIVTLSGLIIAGGIGSVFLFPKSQIHQEPDNLTEEPSRIIEIRTLKNQWRFSPAEVVVKKGETVTLKIYNEDNYPHGYTIPELNINTFLPPLTEEEVVFFAEEVGEFFSACSVPCGGGDVGGHTTMVGIIKVVE